MIKKERIVGKKQIGYIAAYNKRAMKGFTFRFHKENDKELIEHLQKIENKTDYVRQLILQDMKGRK